MVEILITDDELRDLIFSRPYLAVKYHNEDARICRELFPHYNAFSKMEQYADISFVRIDADENLIAKKVIEKNVHSFMSIYKHGLLLECRTISSPKHIKVLLDQLKAEIETDKGEI